MSRLLELGRMCARFGLQLYRELWPALLVFIWGVVAGGAFFIWGFLAHLKSSGVPFRTDPGFFGDFTGWLAFSLSALSLVAFLLLTALINWLIARLPTTGRRDYIALPALVTRLAPGSQAGTAIVIAGFGVGLFLGHNW